ncbi:apolipoprotein N-acyltransferase [Pseudothauera nasutitermitis]|uniref:apolipoprotein N-acyltransferase n=1 Tax=Pseudothauera nasutitermitis TaxID=2565930 RepID=UPI001454C86E|nr:apolipoprotein N-acyltransferase [Pseudothauera nasutitermitis]
MLGAMAWAPGSSPWLLLPVFGGLCRLLARPRRPAPAALLALAFGLGLHACGQAWMIAALFRETGLPPLLALLSAMAATLYLAGFIALPVYLCARCRLLATATPATSPGLTAAACLAALLTAGEWARGSLPGGFSSLSMGYAWLDTPLAGLLPVTGLYGLSFLAYVLCLGWLPVAESLVRRQYGPAVLGALAFAAFLATAHWGAKQPWITPHGDLLGFRLIHTGTAQQDKFSPEHIPAQIDRLAERLTQSPAQLVLAPETALPMFFHQLPAGLVDRLAQAARTHGSHFFIGVALMGGNQQAHNSLLHIPGDGTPLRFFAKEELMPFGEYSPPGFAWFSRHLHFPLKDLSPGPPGQPPFVADRRRLAALICHEEASPRLARRRAMDASVLLNPSNLAWFERSAAIPQGLAMARARALETGRPVLRTTNAGGAAHIDHRGRIAGQVQPGQESDLTGEIRPMQGLTPYVRLGDTPVLLVCAAVLLLAAVRRKRAMSHPTIQEKTA